MTLLFQAHFSGPDQLSYGNFARSGQEWSYWLNPDAFEGNFFPMGYPSVLAVTMRVSGGSTVLYQVLSIAMGLSVAILAWIITYPLGRVTRLLTLVVTACSPAVLWMSQSNGYEMLLCFLLTSSLVLSKSTYHRWRILQVVTAGVLLAAAVLTNGVALSLLPLLAYLVWRMHKTVGGWGGALWAFLGAIATPLALWALRNALVLGDLSPLNKSGGVVFWVGNNPETVVGGNVAYMPAKTPGFSSLYAAAVHFIVTQPEAAFALFLRRVARLLEPTYIYRDTLSGHGLNVMLHWGFIAATGTSVLVFLLYVGGRVWVSPPTLPPVGISAAAVLCFFAGHLPFQAEPRYMLPLVPVALTVCVPTCVWLFRRARSRVVTANMA